MTAAALSGDDPFFDSPLVMHESDEWVEFGRFLLNATAITYGPDKADLVLRCIKSDGPRAIEMITSIRDIGIAQSRIPALFALATAARFGDVHTRALAKRVAPRVIRSATDYRHFYLYFNSLSTPFTEDGR